MNSKLVAVLRMNSETAGRVELKELEQGYIWSDGAGIELRLSLCERIRESIVEKIFSPVVKTMTAIDGIENLAVYELVIDAGKPIRLLRFGLNMPGDPAGFYGVGPEGFSPSLDLPDGPFASDENGKCRISSNSLLAFKVDGTEEITLMGALSFDKTEGTIEFEYDKIDGDARITYKMILDGICLQAEDTLPLDRFTVMTGSDLNLLLQAWAELVAENRGARLPAVPPAGWNDWQY